MIDNSDRVGDYCVRVLANKNEIACFQCPTLKDARQESTRIRRKRTNQGLPTTGAYARQILSKEAVSNKPKRKITYGEKIELL